jgi:hypothetical protein
VILAEGGLNLEEQKKEDARTMRVHETSLRLSAQACEIQIHHDSGSQLRTHLGSMARGHNPGHGV